MADTKISAFPALSVPVAADELVIVDKSDTTDAATGSNKRLLLSTLDARFGSTTILRPEDYGALGDGDPSTGTGTDDTAAFQAMIDAIPAGGATIVLGTKAYKLDSAPRTDRNGYCVLSLNMGFRDRRPIQFVGATTGLGGGVDPPTNRPVLFTTRTTDTYSGTFGPPSLIGGVTTENGGGTTPDNYCGPVTFRDVVISMPNDPAIAAIDGVSFGGLRTDRVAIGCRGTLSAQCTHVNAFGIRLPFVFDFGYEEIKDTVVTGFYNGFNVVGPGAKTLSNAYAYKCVLALGFENDPAGDTHRHALRPSTMLAEFCNYLVGGYSPSAGAQSIGASSGEPFIQYLVIDFEQAGTPFHQINSLLDVNNKLRGTIEFHRNAWPYRLDNFLVSGGLNVRLMTTKELGIRRGSVYMSDVHQNSGGLASQTAVANTLYVVPVQVQDDCPMTGIRYRVGGTAAGNDIVALYESDGTRIAQSSSTAQGTASTMMTRAFTAAVRVHMGRYWLGIIFSSTGTFTGTGPNSYAGPSQSYVQGGFSTPSTITPPADTAAAITLTPALSTY